MVAATSKAACHFNVVRKVSPYRAAWISLASVMAIMMAVPSMGRRAVVPGRVR